MQEMINDFQDMEEAQFPVFPVMFQPQNLDNQLNKQSIVLPQKKGHFNMPETQIKQLISYIESKHDTSYPQLFKQTWQTGMHNIYNFFELYRPLDISYVKSMKEQQQKLKIVRLSSHKMYIGQFIDSKCSGKSIIIFKNGNLYEGDMKQNKRQGIGFYIQSGVGFFKGNFSNDLKNQNGLEIVYKKWGYRGNFLNGLRNEKGLFVDKVNNFSYLGQWKLGIMHGKGTLKVATSTFHGLLVNSLKHGSGQQKFTNGDSYKGQYQNNRFDGFGTYSWKNGEATYEGSFKNGLRHGKGKWSSGQTKYSGSYSEGLKQGYGQLYFPSGNFYKGNFIQDKREGYGEMFWTDGSFYKGDWKNGIQNGKGQIYLVGGEVISGLFENSILVQITPSIYEKQMEISSMGIHDLFGSNPKLDTTNKTRTFSESKNISNAKRKLAKIDESSRKKNSIKDNIYFKSPQKVQPHHQHRGTFGNSGFQSFNNGNSHSANHTSGHHHGKSGQGRQCKCIKRLQNFRLRQRIKTKLNQSKVDQTLNDQN